MARVALCSRVSTGEQAREGVSIEEQLGKLRHYANYRKWKIWDEFRDAGFSGQDDNRPGLRRRRTHHVWFRDAGGFEERARTAW